MLKLRADIIASCFTPISEYIPEIQDTKYVRDFLLTDYKPVSYKYPEMITPRDYEEGEEGQSTHKEKTLKIQKLSIDATATFFCMAKEMTLPDQGLIGYALLFKDMHKSLMTLRNKKAETTKKPGNKSKVEWAYDTEKWVFTRVEADQSSHEEAEVESTISSKSKVKALNSSQFLPSSRNSHSNFSPREEGSQEGSDDDKEMGGTLFARFAKQLHKEWNKPVNR